MIHRKIITMAVAALSLASAAQAQNPPVTSCLEIFGGQGSLNVNSWNPESTKFAFVSYRLQ